MCSLNLLNVFFRTVAVYYDFENGGKTQNRQENKSE